MSFTDFDWRKEAPEVVEQAIALCQGVRASCVSDYSCRLTKLEPEIPYRLDLARVVWEEIYTRRTPSWIYFAQVRGMDLVKVGRSTMVDARLIDLNRRGAKHDLLGTVRGDYREESAAHARFRRHKVHLEEGYREYFWYSPVAEVINDMIVAGEILSAPLGYRQ